MIDARPYDDLAAMAVLSRLDPADVLEAEATRGARVTHLQLFGDWRAMEGNRFLSLVIHTAPSAGSQPFALLGLYHTGLGGVAGAALLARDHRRFRRPLVSLVREIRAQMPGFCERQGIHRIEARAWARHPRALAFLQLCGFRDETPGGMPGHGCDGSESFHLFAYVPALPRPTP